MKRPKLSGSRRAALALLLAAAGASAPVQAQEPLEGELWSFVSSGWSHGTPYAEALAFRSRDGAAELLRKWLDEPSRARAWKNILLTLGVVGSDEDTNRLRSFILEGSAAIDEPLLRERAAAIQALAFLAHEAGVQGRDSKALELLIQSADPRSSFWSPGSFQWRGVGDAAMRQSLTKALDHQVILALSLTGADRVGALLATLSGVELRHLVEQDVVADASRSYGIVRNARARGRGLAELYADQQPGP